MDVSALHFTSAHLPLRVPPQTDAITESRVRSLPHSSRLTNKQREPEHQVEHQIESLLSPKQLSFLLGEDLRLEHCSVPCVMTARGPWPLSSPFSSPPSAQSSAHRGGMLKKISPPCCQPRKSKHCLSVPSPIVIHRVDKYLIPSKDTFC